jgi:hypothetical protein
MRIVLVVAVLAVVVGVPVWVLRRLRIYLRATDQFVTLTPKRHAELLDVQRRQHEEG